MRLSVHSGIRMPLSVLSALLFVLPLVFVSQARADWIVRDGAEPAPLVAPAPRPSAAPAAQAGEENLAAPQQPKGPSASCGGCLHSRKTPCRAKTGEGNATCPMDRNATGPATGKDIAQLMDSTVKFRIQSLAQVEPDDPKVVAIVGAKLTDANPKLRRESVGVLGLLSAYYPDKAAEIFPYLLKAVNDSDPNVHSAALKAMLPTVAHLQEQAALPLLNEALAKGNSAERGAVAAVIANMSGKLPWVAQLSGALRTALQDSNQDTRLAVIMALAFIDPALLPDDTVSLLQENTRSKSAGTRFQAFSLLAVIGPKAVDALPELLKGVHDPHNVPRWAAVHALGALGREIVRAHPEIIEALIQAADGTDVPVQQIAAFSLGKNLGSPVLPGVLPGTENPAAVEVLQKLLQSEQPSVVETAAWALVRIEPKRRAALPEKIRVRLSSVTPALDQMAAQ